MGDAVLTLLLKQLGCLPAGWAFLVLFFGFVIAITLWLLRYNPGLLTERMTGIGKADQKTWDKIFFGVLNLCFFAWLIVMPPDAVRFGWSHLPFWLQVVGALLMLIGWHGRCRCAL